MTKLKYHKELLFILLVLGLHLAFGLWMSRNLLFFYSRVEFAWKIFNAGFFKNLFDDFTPPGYYVLPGFLAQITHLSIGFWQKFVDLLCGDLIIAFVTIYALYKKNVNWLYPLLLGVFSFGLLLPLVLQGGEAVVALPIILGLWCLTHRKYIAFGLLFALSTWFKFLQIFVSPVVSVLLLYRYFFNKLERRPIIISVVIILLSFCTYLFLDHAIGLHFQLLRGKSLSLSFSIWQNLTTFISNFAGYSFIVILSLPFVFFGKKFLSLNIYTASAFFTLVAISMFGIGPYYAYPVVALIYVGVFMREKVSISLYAVLFSIFLGLVITQTNPMDNILHGSNQTKQERNWLISEISKNYSGGLVVIPFDFALEFPYRHYLLDGLPNDAKFFTEIEYVFAPKGLVPLTLLQSCQLTYSSRISEIILFRAVCK